MKNTMQKMSVMGCVRSPMGLFAMSAATLLVTGFTLSGNISLSPFNLAGSEQERYVERVTPLSFEQVKVGMTLAEVRSVMGEPGAEVSSSAEISEYRWGDLAGPNMTGQFESGRLTFKQRHNF